MSFTASFALLWCRVVEASSHLRSRAAGSLRWQLAATGELRRIAASLQLRFRTAEAEEPRS